VGQRGDDEVPTVGKPAVIAAKVALIEAVEQPKARVASNSRRKRADWTSCIVRLRGAPVWHRCDPCARRSARVHMLRGVPICVRPA